MRCSVTATLGIIGVLASLSACVDRLASAEQIAASVGMKRVEVVAAPFVLTSFERVSDASKPFTIYIEGDGAAWSTESEPSLDPTPRRVLALRLAALDPAANIIYLARPCQFTWHDPACNDHYWTDRRFSPEVIDSMNKAIDRLLGEQHGPITLVGYSGGGAVAALIAARRYDVASLRTIAGNLDPVALARYHEASPLTGSLSPMDVAVTLATVPQQHFVGTHDEVVPGFVAVNFVHAMGNSSYANIISVDAGHEDGWEDFWRRRYSLFSDH